MKKVTAREWIEHHERWKASRKTQKGYCKSEGINYSTFKNRVYQSRKRSSLAKRPIPESRTSKFQEVQVISEAQSRYTKEPYCEIRFRGEHRLEISSPETLVKLKEVIQCLISCNA